MFQHPGHEGARRRRHAIGPGGIAHHGLPLGILEAHMNMDAIADTGGIEDRREDRARAQALGGRAGDLAHDDGIVGGPHPDGRLAGDLILPGAIFRQEGIGDHAGLAKSGGEGLAEDSLAAIGIQAVGRTRQLFHPGIDELLLEGREQAITRDLLQRRQTAAQEIARAAGPGRAVGLADIAEIEMLRRAFVVIAHPDLGLRIGHQDQIAGGPEGRIADGAEAGDHAVGRNPAHALAQALRQVLQGEALAPDPSGHLAGADHDERFAIHLPLSWLFIAGSAGRCPTGP
jgi:hypothetical protein